MTFFYDLEFRETRTVNSIVEIVADIMGALSTSGENQVLLMKRLRKSFSIKPSSVQSLSSFLPALSNRYCHGLENYLKRLYPLLSQPELDFCCLLAMGLSAADISFAYGFDHPATFYNKRYKIRKKMDIPPSSDLESHLRNLSDQLEIIQKKAVRQGIEDRSLDPVIKIFEL